MPCTSCPPPETRVALAAHEQAMFTVMLRARSALVAETVGGDALHQALAELGTALDRESEANAALSRAVLRELEVKREERQARSRSVPTS